MKKSLLSLFVVCILCSSIFAQSHKTFQSHSTIITKINPANDQKQPQSFYTVSEDGYLIKWPNTDNIENNAGEHYQLSEYWIKDFSISPKGNEIAVYETNGGNINRISVWNWKKLQKIYQKEYEDTITSLKYSAKGNYLLVGTSSIEGLEVLKASNGTKVNKIKENISIVNYIFTSESEKTAVFYSTSGTLTYINFDKGEIKTKFSIAQGLNQTILFNDSKVFSGVRGNEIYLYNAFKGKLISTIKTNNPIILSNEKDNDLYYAVKESGKYSIYKAVPSESLDTVKSILVKQFNLPKDFSNIIAGNKINNEVIFGTTKGQIFKVLLDEPNENEYVQNITQNTFNLIYDISKAYEENEFFILTKDSILKTDFISKQNEKIFSTSGQKNFIVTESGIILWSKESITPITNVDLSTNKSEILFTPGFQIKNLKYCNYNNKKYLLEIENNGIINLYDFETKKIKQIYTGAGIQDAIISNDGFIYIAKSSAIYPNTPLLKVNIQTYETVPTDIKGNITFSLETDEDGKFIYGIIFTDDANDKNTYVFEFNTEKQSIKNILKFDEIDTDAFTYYNNNTLFTNIGKNLIYSYNIKKNKKMAYKRSAAIPSNISQNTDYVVILNSNGSLSWAKSKNNAIIEDWYLTQDNEWTIISGK